LRSAPKKEQGSGKWKGDTLMNKQFQLYWTTNSIMF